MIDLTGLEAEDGWTQIGDALRGNASHQVLFSPFYSPLFLFLSSSPFPTFLFSINALL